MLDTVNLLSFPSFSNGLSRFRNAGPSDGFGSRKVTTSSPGSSTDSPPRKTLKLSPEDGDDSRRLTRSTKGKGRETEALDSDSKRDVQQLVVTNPAGTRDVHQYSDGILCNLFHRFRFRFVRRVHNHSKGLNYELSFLLT